MLKLKIENNIFENLFILYGWVKNLESDTDTQMLTIQYNVIMLYRRCHKILFSKIFRS